MPTPLRPRFAALLVAASAGLVLSGCSFFSPDTSLEPYAPAEGLQTELGDLMVRNMLVVSEGGGEPGLLIGALVNRGEDDVTVGVEVGGTTAEIGVPAGSSVSIGAAVEPPDGERPMARSETVEVDEVGPAAGDVIELTVTDSAAGSVVLQVPVQLPDGPYADLVP